MPQAVLNPLKAPAINFPHFPTVMQCVVFRNWDLVPADKLAAVLGCTAGDVAAAAEGMGLSAQDADFGEWRAKGYITIIRLNWHILTYGQIMELLGIDEDELAYILKEDDFLSHKLGAKPDVPPARFTELTPDQIEATEQLRAVVSGLPLTRGKRPFDFFDEDFLEDAPDITMDNMYDILKQKNASYEIVPDETLKPESHRITVTPGGARITAVDITGVYRACQWLSENAGAPEGTYDFPAKYKNRIIYSYCALYGDTTPDMLAASYPEALLRQYAKLRVNGIWLQAILYTLSPFPFDTRMSAGYEERLAALRELIETAARYGIRVFLYLNEPRAMPAAFFDKYPDLKGSPEGGFNAMCTSAPAVKNYLRDAVRYVCERLPGLGGIFTITASENLTNCYSRCRKEDIACPRCKERDRADVIAEVNAIISDAAKGADPDIDVIAWAWAWYDRGDIDRILANTPKDLIIQCTSEEALPVTRGGIENTVVDYTISEPGPSERSLATWAGARAHGHGTSAKMQINITWECSAVPYIPTFKLIEKHLDNIAAAGVDSVQLCWTLGGYPSVNLAIAAGRYFGGAEHDVLRGVFGGMADTAREVSDKLSDAFSLFPFDCGTVYAGPMNYGPHALFYGEKTGERATMIGFPYDDVNAWRSVYPLTVFIGLFEEMTDKWKTAVDILPDGGNKSYKLFVAAARAMYCHLRSTYNQLRFVAARDSGDKNAMKTVLEEEIAVTKDLLSISLAYPQIGYEASNHYYYTRHSLCEKVINCEFLLNRL